MSKVVKFDFKDKDSHSKAIEIRMRVFVAEQHVDAAIEVEHEEEAIHFLLYYRRKPVATARYRFTEKGIKLERFAMLSDFRGKGLGNDLLRFVLNDARRHKQRIYLNAQTQVIGYYEKFGFKIKGDPFEEANIQHYLMEYEPINNKEKALEKAICRR